MRSFQRCSDCTRCRSTTVNALPKIQKTSLKNLAIRAQHNVGVFHVRYVARQRDVLRQQDSSVLLRHCCDDINKFWGFGQAILQRGLQSTLSLRRLATLCWSAYSHQHSTSRFTLFKSTSLPSLTPATSSPTISAIALTRACN